MLRESAERAQPGSAMSVQAEALARAITRWAQANK
jgi:hypothetical protein